MVKNSHPLASVNGVFNAVYVTGEAVGETMFYGAGAGELPTATSIVADLVAVVRNLKLGINGRTVQAPYKEKKLKTDEANCFQKLYSCCMLKIKQVYSHKLHKFLLSMKLVWNRCSSIRIKQIRRQKLSSLHMMLIKLV